MRKILVLTAILLIALLAVSCSSDNNNGITEPQGYVPEVLEDNANQIVKEDDWFPDFSDIELDGYEFRILNARPDSVGHMLIQLEAEEITGEIFNDAVFARNRAVEDKLDILINETRVGSLGDVVNSCGRMSEQAMTCFTCIS